MAQYEYRYIVLEFKDTSIHLYYTAYKIYRLKATELRCKNNPDIFLFIVRTWKFYRLYPIKFL